jgi:hypothetical protein
MVGPRGNERIEETGEQAGEKTEHGHQRGERKERREFDGVEVSEGGGGDAGARTVEDALPESQEEESGGEETERSDGRSDRM